MKQRYTDYKIIVVDDGSVDGTSGYLQSHFDNVIVLQGDGNLWWTGATNLGVNKALQLSTSPNDFILTLNNDLEVKEDYLESLLAAAKHYPISLIGSVSVDINTPDKVHFAGTKWSASTAKYKRAICKSFSYKELVKAHDIINTDLLPGRGTLIPIVLFNVIGLFDDSAFPHYMADEDFALRAKKMHYKLLIATKAVVYNHVSETGLKKQAKSFMYYKNVFTSIRSPVNFNNRWRWAKKHANIFPPVYFLFDMTRIVKGFFIKS